MITDPILSEVHRIKEQIAQDAGYDLEKLYQRFLQAEKEVCKARSQTSADVANSPILPELVHTSVS